MSSKGRPPRITVTCGGRIPSVELGAIIPLSELQKQGMCEFRYKDEVFLSPADIAWCDILLIVRGASAQSVWAARWARRHERIILGYWDDDFLSIPSHNPTYSYYSSPWVKKNMDSLFKLTDTFFSPNPRLAAKLSSIHGKQAKVLPGVLGPQALRRPRLRNNQTLTIGFAGGTVYVDELNCLVGPALAAVATIASFRVHLIGAKPNFIDSLAVETVHTQHIPNYYDYLAFAAELNWDIGLAPQIDCEFTAHKFYNKLLEYAHIGCAGVYSKLEPYASVIDDGVTGLLVPNEVEAWRDAILKLLKDSKLRFKIASNACEFAQSHHSRQIVAEKYKEALAPYLAYRAPAVGRGYAISSDIANRPKRLWRMGMEYTAIHGFWYVLRRGPRFLFRLLRQRRR